MLVCIAGKNNIAVEALEYLIQEKSNRIDEIGVLCNRNDDGVNSWQKSLRYYAKAWGIKEYSLEELYDVEKLVFISLEFDRIIRPSKFKNARLYNVHFSLLPKYKGMYTSAIPILNGEKESGVTLHEIDNGIDTGNIIEQVRFEIPADCTCRELYFLYLEHGSKLIRSKINDLIAGNIESKPQSPLNSSYFSKKFIDYKNLKIDLCQTAENIERQIRAFNFKEYQMPKVNGKEICKAKIMNTRSVEKAGSVLYQDNARMIVSTIDYDIELFISD